MIQVVSGTYYDLDQLAAEMVLAGLLFTDLGTDGTDIFTYDDFGAEIPLPAGADVVVLAHVPSHLERDLLALAAQPAVGMRVAELTDDMGRDLLACALFKLGAVDKHTSVVLPILDWLT